MGRILLAVLAGFVAWSAIWLVAGLVLMAVFVDVYAEDGRTVTAAGVLVLLILVSVLASLVSGWLAALIGRAGGSRAARILAVLLLLVGLGVEISGWAYTPVWYHLVFLGLLVPATMAGAALKR